MESQRQWHGRTREIAMPQGRSLQISFDVVSFFGNIFKINSKHVRGYLVKRLAKLLIVNNLAILCCSFLLSLLSVFMVDSENKKCNNQNGSDEDSTTQSTGNGCLLKLPRV
jgi:hypothetical protein